MFENHSKFRKAEAPDSAHPPKAGPAAPTGHEARCGASPARGLDLPSSPLGRLRLLVALDALLVEGSVARAARSLELSAPAMSRLLAQLRAHYGDEILMRRGRGLVPTPFAERLRARVRAVATEAGDLMEEPAAEPAPDPGPDIRLPIIQYPPLAVNPTPLIQGQPDPRILSRRLAGITAEAEPKLRLARHIATIGGGQGHSRTLDMAEAADAFDIILGGKADPIQVGALLVAMQHRGVTANELAGMVRAARRAYAAPDTGPAPADIDWPIYRSPRIMSPPWFLLAARLVAYAGYRVVLHGFGGGLGQMEDALAALSIPTALSVEEARDVLPQDGIVFIPLFAVSAQLQALVGLYHLFEMRSPINHVLPLLNPLGARATLVGIPSTAARTLHRDAAAMLGWSRLLAVGSNRDVAQATPARTMPLMLLDQGRHHDALIPAADRQPSPRGSSAGFSTVEYLEGLWSGAVRDSGAREIVVATAALGLMAAAPGTLAYDAALERARQLWDDRPVRLP